MVDRRLVFGDPADAGTRWAMDDAAGSTGGGNFVLARDLDGGGVLLRYNPTSGNFEPFAPVDLGGEDILDGSTTVYHAATDTVGDGTTSANHESVNTDKARIGSADTVSGGPVGDAGDDVILDSEGPAPDTFETTSTTYLGFFGGGDEVVFDFSLLTSLTNIDDLGLGIAGEITNSDAQETTTVAILTEGEEFAEYSHTGDDIGKFYTSPDYTPTLNGEARLVPRLKVSGGTGTVYNLRVIVWGEIK